MKTILLKSLFLIIILGLIAFFFVILIQLKNNGFSELMFYKITSLVLGCVSVNVLFFNNK